MCSRCYVTSQESGPKEEKKILCKTKTEIRVNEEKTKREKKEKMYINLWRAVDCRFEYNSIQNTVYNHILLFIIVSLCIRVHAFSLSLSLSQYFNTFTASHISIAVARNSQYLSYIVCICEWTLKFDFIVATSEQNTLVILLFLLLFFVLDCLLL